MLNRLAIVGAALAILGSASLSSAQPAPGGSQQPPSDSTVQQAVPDRRAPQQAPAFSREDVASNLDARVAALHSGLQLTSDQEALWPPFEKAYRDFAQIRFSRAAAPAAADNDLPARVEQRAEALIRRGTALKALADAGAPLWRSLDDSQKRRFMALIRPNGARLAERGFDAGRGYERGSQGFDGRDRDGFERRGDDGGRRGFGDGRDGERFGFGAPRGFGPRDFGPRDRRDFGRDGDGDRFGYRGDRYGDRYGFGRRGFGGDDGDRYGYAPRDFGRRYGPPRFGDDGDRFGFGERRDFGRRDFGPRDFGPRDFRSRGFGPRDFGYRDFDGRGRDRGYGDRFHDFGRGGLPWWWRSGFRTLDDTNQHQSAGERQGGERSDGGANDQI
jgi:zinc resistance-associated protein